MSYFDEFFPNAPNIDGREEFEKTIYGDVGSPGVGRPVILRRLQDQHCACWDGLTGGPVSYCSYCMGEGFLFTEETHLMFIADGTSPIFKPGVFGGGQYPLTQWGQADPSKSTAYCSWTVYPDYERYTYKTQKRYDKILLLKVDGTGAEFFPSIITAQFKVMNVTPRHGTCGMVEYIELSLEKENI